MALWAGLLVGLLSAIVSFLNAGLVLGMGHGWGVPMTLSLLLGFLVFPGTALLAARGPASDILRTTIGVLLLISCAYLFFQFGMHSYWGADTRGALGSAEFPRATACAALLLALGAMLVLSRYGISRRNSVLLLPAALSDEVLWYSMTHRVETWNYRGGEFELLWLLVWSSWQIVLVVAIVRGLLAREDGLAMEADDAV